MYTDLFLLVAIILFGISGFFQGFVLQIISLLGLVAIVLFSSPLARLLKEQTDWQAAHSAPVFMLWCFSALAIVLLSIAIRLSYLKFRKNPGLTPIDRWLGFGMGTLKGSIFAFVAGLVLVHIPKDLRDSFAELDRDLTKSKIIASSQHLKNWDFIPSIAELKSIQKELRNHTTAAKEREMQMEELE